MKDEQLRVHFRSERTDWETPPKLFRELDARWNFEIDVCASEENAKCVRYFTINDNGLTQIWAPLRCWMNPPYGREIGKWMKKAYEESMKGALVVCLVPSRTDTSWWHDYAMRGDIEFLRGRLCFGDGCGRAPFPSAVIVFGARVAGALAAKGER